MLSQKSITRVLIVKVLIIVYFTMMIVTSRDVNTIHLHKRICMTPETLPQTMIFHEGMSPVDCVINTNLSMAAIAVKEESSRKKQCAIIWDTSEIPNIILSNCTDPRSIVSIYVRLDQTKNARKCDAELIIYNRQHCLRKTNKTAYTLDEAESICEDMGGQLPWAETPEDVKVIRELFDTAVRVWMGASYNKAEGVYKWTGGDEVPKSVWLPGKPVNNNGGNPWVAILHKPGKQLLFDVPAGTWAKRWNVVIHVVCSIVY